MRGYVAAASVSSAPRPAVSATSLDHARAVNGHGRSLVFVPYDKDRDGNRLTHVFRCPAARSFMSASYAIGRRGSSISVMTARHKSSSIAKAMLASSRRSPSGRA